MLIQTSTAGPGLSEDILRNSVFRLSDIDREITGAYVQQTGTVTTIGQIDLFVSDVLVANIVANTAAAQGLVMFPVDAEVPGGSEIRAIVAVAPAGANNALTVSIQIDELLDDDDAMMDEY